MTALCTFLIVQLQKICLRVRDRNPFVLGLALQLGLALGVRVSLRVNPKLTLTLTLS